MASGREQIWSRNRWLPFGVGLVGILLSIAGWLYLVSVRRGEINSMAADVAAQSRSTIASTVRNEVSALQNLAGFWGAVGRRPVDEWRADVAIVIESHPHLNYIAWIYPDGRSARVAAGKEQTVERPEIAPRDRPVGDTPLLFGPEPDASGVPTFRVLLPVLRGETSLGMLEAQWNAQSLLAGTLAESAPGYALRVEWAGVELFSRGEPTSDPWQDWWRESGEVQLPLGAVWTVHHAPTPGLAAVWLDPVPHYLLVVGIFLAIALGVVTHHLRESFVRARFLAAGNEALEASAGELRRLNAALEARVRERTQELEAFTHSISHDLKSPLGAILNFAAILELDYRDEPLDDEGRELLGRIRTSASRGNELLEGLLRLTRAGRDDLHFERVDMNALAKEAFAMARQSEPDCDVTFTLESLPEAKGDRTLIREVLVNLFDNALKYSRKQDDRQIAIRAGREGDQWVYVGGGQRSGLRHAPFGEAVRALRAPAVREGGGRHRRRARARGAHPPPPRRSHLGRVPARRGRALLLHAPPESGGILTEPRDILLVDDDPNDVDIALRALRRDGVDVPVSVARGGEEALAVLGVEASEDTKLVRPSVVFLDLKMPGVDGWEVLERLRDHPDTERLPVVVLSWSGAREDVERCYALGANSYLVKHFEGERPGAYFVEAVRYWVGLNHAPGGDAPSGTL